MFPAIKIEPEEVDMANKANVMSEEVPLVSYNALKKEMDSEDTAANIIEDISGKIKVEQESCNPASLPLRLEQIENDKVLVTMVTGRSNIPHPTEREKNKEYTVEHQITRSDESKSGDYSLRKRKWPFSVFLLDAYKNDPKLFADVRVKLEHVKGPNCNNLPSVVNNGAEIPIQKLETSGTDMYTICKFSMFNIKASKVKVSSTLKSAIKKKIESKTIKIKGKKTNRADLSDYDSFDVSVVKGKVKTGKMGKDLLNEKKLTFEENYYFPPPVKTTAQTSKQSLSAQSLPVKPAGDIYRSAFKGQESNIINNEWLLTEIDEQEESSQKDSPETRNEKVFEAGKVNTAIPTVVSEIADADPYFVLDLLQEDGESKILKTLLSYPRSGIDNTTDLSIQKSDQILESNQDVSSIPKTVSLNDLQGTDPAMSTKVNVVTTSSATPSEHVPDVKTECRFPFHLTGTEKSSRAQFSRNNSSSTPSCEQTHSESSANLPTFINTVESPMTLVGHSGKKMADKATSCGSEILVQKDFNKYTCIKKHAATYKFPPFPVRHGVPDMAHFNKEFSEFMEKFGKEISVSMKKCILFEHLTKFSSQQNKGILNIYKSKRLHTSRFGDVLRAYRALLTSPMQIGSEDIQIRLSEGYVEEMFDLDNCVKDLYQLEKLKRRAISLYIQHKKYTDQKSVYVDGCGLVINPAFPHFVATPDGKVAIRALGNGKDICNIGVLTIYSPELQSGTSLQVASQSKDFCLTCHGTNKLTINKSHNCYYEIQGTLAVTGLKWCDFVVYTDQQTHVEQVPFDEDIWKEYMFPQLTKFYIDHAMSHFKLMSA